MLSPSEMLAKVLVIKFCNVNLSHFLCNFSESGLKCAMNFMSTSLKINQSCTNMYHNFCPITTCPLWISWTPLPVVAEV
jgi:hypothetical protein